MKKIIEQTLLTRIPMQPYACASVYPPHACKSMLMSMSHGVLQDKNDFFILFQ